MNRLLFFLIISGLFFSCEEEEKRPNILFAIADDATYMHFGAYGCDWVSTPAFDRVARQG
ncbi:MAG: hypothetical protein RLQ12_07470 [Cyclobacteriaceae bacterium]